MRKSRNYLPLAAKDYLSFFSILLITSFRLREEPSIVHIILRPLVSPGSLDLLFLLTVWWFLFEYLSKARINIKCAINAVALP